MAFEGRLIITSNTDFFALRKNVQQHVMVVTGRGKLINLPCDPMELLKYLDWWVCERDYLRTKMFCRMTGIRALRLDIAQKILEFVHAYAWELPLSLRLLNDLAKEVARFPEDPHLHPAKLQKWQTNALALRQPALKRKDHPPSAPTIYPHSQRQGQAREQPPGESMASDPEPKTTVNMFTNPEFAARSVRYFKPSGRVLDPCRGKGAFFNAMPAGSDWCEITEGRDFLAYTACCDWIVTNPPWSRAYRDIAKHAFEIADNVVFRLHDAQDHGHAIREIIDVSWRDAGFIVHGIRLVIVHRQRGWTGGITQSEWPAQPADLEDGPPEPPLAVVPEPPRPDPAAGPELADGTGRVRAGRQRPPPPLHGLPGETLLEHFKRLERQRLASGRAKGHGRPRIAPDPKIGSRTKTGSR